MSNTFIGTGNVGTIPELKTVPVGTEDRAVLEFRCFFDRPVRLQNGEYEDRGGFWTDVAIWGPRTERYSKLLRKGMRVRLEGTLVLRTWNDKTSGEPRHEFTLNAEELFFAASRIEKIVLVQREPREESAAQGGESDPFLN